MVKAKKNIKKLGKKVKKVVKVNKKTKQKTKQKTKNKKVSAIPKGYHSVTPYLIVNDGKRAIAFYQKAFNAKIVMIMEKEDGKIGHAELQMGDSKMMLADEHPEMNALAPQSDQRPSVGIHLYVKAVDDVIARAVAAGAKITRPVTDQFYGDRSGGLEDPFGHCWYVSTHIEDVTPAKIKKRLAEMSGKH